ncbi:hypothetical protein HDU81_007640 [Chytriomyces hyalinus]|nr:hypothetical protein HDU81_007640 [Chytriomyces hyalinus]
MVEVRKAVQAKETLHRASASAQTEMRTRATNEAGAYWEGVARGIEWGVAPVFGNRAQPAAEQTVLTPANADKASIALYTNLVGRHAADPRHKHAPALLYDGPLANALTPSSDAASAKNHSDGPTKGVKLAFSFSQLDTRVRAVARCLMDLNVTQGDVVLIYMPMVPEAVFAMLACVRIAAVHAVVFGGFAATELAKRIQDAQPKVIIYASCGLEPKRVIPYKEAMDEALAISTHQPAHLVLLNRPELPVTPLPAKHVPFPTPHSYKTAVLNAMPEPTVAPYNSPLYLLYTSGSTGKPKGVVRDVGGHALALKHAMDWILGVKKGDVFFSASDIGWVVGHTFIVYGPLLQGCATVLYEGKPVMPKEGAAAFWRIVQEYKVSALYTAPTALRAIRREDPNGQLIRKYNLKSLVNVFIAGERCDPDTACFFTKKLGVPLRDNFWQTETGTPITGPCSMIETKNGGHLTLPKMGSCGPPVPGFDMKVLVPPKHHAAFEKTLEQSRGKMGGSNLKGEPGNEFTDDGEPAHRFWVEASPGEVGSLVIKLPLPPGCFPTLWKNHAGYLKSYFERFPGYYDLTDQGFIDEDGYVTVLGRSDDVLNVAGHRLSSGGIEEVVSNHPAVAECAVIGKKDGLKGEKPIAFVVLKHVSGAAPKPSVVERELVAAVREKIGAVACFETVVVVSRLPKTRSGKILRRSLRAISNGEVYGIPATIEDPEVLHEIATMMKGTAGNGKSKL